MIHAAEPGVRHYSKPEVRKELVGVVDAQLAAFRSGDFKRAYGFAARPLRAQFTLKEFTAMITRSYPFIAHNERAEPGLPMDDGETATLAVRVFGAGGKSADYRYLLTREADGWRISGVLPELPQGPEA
ncbi:MAG: DUF4864 domain-containing protein [Opitutus sp.]